MMPGTSLHLLSTVLLVATACTGPGSVQLRAARAVWPVSNSDGAKHPAGAARPDPRTELLPSQQGPGHLPPIPKVHGPLEIRIVYPSPTDVVAAEDSSFLFGSVGDGDATLSVNGRPVPVAPNGAFLAWLPFPRDSV